MRISVPAMLATVFLFASPAFADDKDCNDFKTKQEAQAWLDKYKSNPKADDFIDDDLDRNEDGVACEDYDFKTGKYKRSGTGN